MTGKKNALGRGLGALIPEAKQEDAENAKGGIINIDINKISPNEDQPRKKFDQDKIEKLADSISEHGVIQPIIVSKDGEYYTIIAGERRWRAAKAAGLKTIPVIQRELSPLDIMEISLIENLQREDLNPIEEAGAYKRLMDEFKLTQEEIAEKIGRSRPAIANSLRLLNLSSKVQSYIIDGILSEGHGKILVGIQDKRLQNEVAKKIIDEGLSVRQTESLIKALGNKKKTSRKKDDKDIYIRDIEERLKGYFGTKVIINNGKNKGKIEIEYYSEEDLQRIIEIFNI